MICLTDHDESITPDQDPPLMASDCKLLTVAELIALLQTLPQESVYPVLTYNVPGRWDVVTIGWEQKGDN